MTDDWVCSFCGGEFDGNGDCPNYCEDGFCGVCQEEVSAEHTHRKKKGETIDPTWR